jgi:hypothetical protein
MVYGVSGDNYNDLGALIRAGVIDHHFLIHGGGNTPPAQFPKDCRAVGGSPVLNNGNDGIAGWNGSASYYQNVANLGYMAAGGESEQAPEIDSIMDNTIFMDYGGAGTGGGTNDNVWYVTHPAPVHGHGAASYLETYGYSSDFWDWSIVGQGALNAKSHGVKEVGILVGNWMMASKYKTTAEYLKTLMYKSTAQDYINLANAYEAHGITCAGIVVWGGYGTNMNSLYTQFAGWFKAWQAIWPPNMTPMDKRYGAAPPPTIKCFDAGSIKELEDIMENMNSVDIGINPNEGSAPAPCAVGTKVYVFVQGTDDVLYVKCRTNNVWTGWQSLGGILTSSPGVCVTSDSHIIVTVRGKADAQGKAAAWYREYDGKAWSSWQGLGGEIQ